MKNKINTSVLYVAALIYAQAVAAQPIIPVQENDILVYQTSEKTPSIYGTGWSLPIKQDTKIVRKNGRELYITNEDHFEFDPILFASSFRTDLKTDLNLKIYSTKSTNKYLTDLAWFVRHTVPPRQGSRCKSIGVMEYTVTPKTTTKHTVLLNDVPTTLEVVIVETSGTFNAKHCPTAEITSTIIYASSIQAIVASTGYAKAAGLEFESKSNLIRIQQHPKNKF